ncbi:hypothetical protein Tco_1328759 [Tanacetum coccineum]
MFQLALYDYDEILKTHHVHVSVTSSEEDLEIAEITMQKMNEKMNDPAIELEAENFKLLEKIQNDDHDTMIKDFSKLEIAHLNLQLKHQHLKENIENFKSKSSKDVPKFDAFLNSVNGMIRFKSLDSQNLCLTETVTALQEQLEHFKAENEKVKQHYQELFNSIKITRVKTIKRTPSLQTKIENLKTQLKGKMPCVTSNVESPKVSVFEKYAIEVESIPPSQRNNRDVHHHYLNHLRDTLDTLRKIVKEAKSKRPSDHSLDYTCVYTRRSQELLENVSDSCPKASNKRDKVIATTPLTRKKHVTFADPLETSDNNTTNHVKHPTVQKTNVPIIHSTGVKQTWKPTGKVFTTVGYHWKSTGRIFPLGVQCPLTRNTKPRVVPVKQWKLTGRPIPLGGQCPIVRPTALDRGTMPADPQGNNTPAIEDEKDLPELGMLC